MHRIIVCAAMFAAWPALTVPANAQTPPAAPAPPAAQTPPAAQAPPPPAAQTPPAAQALPALPAPWVTACGAPPSTDAFDALDYCTKIIQSGQIGPQLLEAYYWRAQAYDTKSDFVDALADYSKVIELDPQGSYAGGLYTKEAYLKRGSDYVLTGAPDLAIANFSTAIGLFPNDPDFYEMRAERYVEKQDYAAAIADYTKEIQVGDTSEKAFAYDFRAKMYLAKNDDDNALADYVKSIQLYRVGNRAAVDALRHLGDNYLYAKGDWDKAILAYSTALKGRPNHDAVIYVRLSTAYLRKGDFDRAVDTVNRAIERFPKFTPAYSARCWLRALSGKVQITVVDCDAALTLDPNDRDSLDGRALAYYKLFDYDKALADYGAALKTDPKRASALYGRGMAKLKLGDATGTADIDAAKAINPDIATVPPTKFLK
jgi:tetratricopeptide (TPR) repeat protein